MRDPSDEMRTQVTVDGKPLSLRLDLHAYSPTGFEWGYMGSGPSQLAFALLVDCLGRDVAEDHAQDFKRQVISTMPREGWVLTELDVLQWLEEQRRQYVH